MTIKPNKRDAYLEKLDAHRQDLAADLAKLDARLRAVGAEAEIDVAEVIEELEERQDRVRKKVRGLKEASEDSWESVKESAEEAMSTLVAAMTDAKERVETQLQEK